MTPSQNQKTTPNPRKPKAWALVLLLAAILAFSVDGAAQEPTDTSALYYIVTLDGNAFIGKILEDDGVQLILETEAFGTLTIQRANIQQMRPVGGSELRGREAWMYHPQATRYFYSPTGYGLRKGEGYYQNVLVFFNQIAVGITDHVSIGAGIVPLFLFAGAPTPVWITPKVSIPIVPDKFSIGGGALLGMVIGEEEAFFGIPYGIATFGDRNTNLSVGVGYGFAGGEIQNAPTIEVNGMARISPKSYLLSENLILNDGGETLVVLSFGGRTVWTSVSLDYGLVVPVNTGGGEFFAVPLLGLVVPFGQKQPLPPSN